MTTRVFIDGAAGTTGLEIADGGLYVAQEPNLLFLKDTDGDDVAGCECVNANAHCVPAVSLLIQL